MDLFIIILEVIKYIALTIAIIFTFTNFGRLFRSQRIPTANIVLMGISIVAFIIIQFRVLPIIYGG